MKTKNFPTKTSFCAAALAASMLLSQSAGASPQRFGLNAPLVGTWQVAISPVNLPAFTAYNVFSADGNSTEFDNSNPPSQQTIAVGPWIRVGPADYMMVEVNQLFDPQGNFFATLRVKSSITLDRSEDKFTSKFTLTVTDPKGNVVFESNGTAIGQRIEVN